MNIMLEIAVRNNRCVDINLGGENRVKVFIRITSEDENTKKGAWY